ncbi:MAG TPA: hypothetical protein VI300_05680 [Solirubrobacter sp.]
MSVRPATLAALLLSAIALAVAGCGSDDNETAAQSTPAATEAATQAATETPDADADAQSEDKDAGGDGDSEAEREKEAEESGNAADKDCDEVGDDLTGNPKKKMPSDIGPLSYAHLYKSEGPFGKTERFYAVLDGTPEDLASRRDDVQNELVQNYGFASLSTDQEEGAEAEAHLKGAKHTVDVQVVPLCKGKLRIRYTVQ